MNYRAFSLFFGGALAALLSVPGSFADIRDTPHNFTRKEKGKRAGDKEVCAFCHTPVIALGEGTRPTVPPAWAHSLGTDVVFTIYDDIGRLGAGRISVGSQSMACLSCHDTNQAAGMDSSSGSDHPFGVPYLGFVKVNPGVARLSTLGQNSDSAPARFAGSVVRTEDFQEVSSGTVEGRSVWWVSPTGVTARRGKGDLPLYSRAAAEDGIPYIECSSCHDPHSVNSTFLRVNNDGSRLCFTCHAK